MCPSAIGLEILDAIQSVENPSVTVISCVVLPRIPHWDKVFRNQSLCLCAFWGARFLSERTRLVIIDTQARFTKGDENKQVDADSYINAFNSLAAIFNANIIVVHHTSKSNGETLKGSVNFKGGL